MAGLRSLAWRGGIAMAVRQVLGMALSFAGLVALARLIGPASYGTYVSALAVNAWLLLFFQWGVDVFLVRKAEEPGPDDAHQAFTLGLALGVLAALLAWPAGRAAEAWIGIAGVGRAVTALMLAIPVQLAAAVPLALLQRRMDYARLAWAELGGHAANYTTAVALALWGWRVGAPVGGWWAQQTVTCVLAFALSGYRPRPVWRPALLKTMLGYGLGYSASVWLWQLRMLVNPLIVARLLGPEAAAGVAVAVRMVEALTFLRVVTWRVALSAMGRLQHDRARMAKAVVEGMRLQVIAIGPILAGFALVAPWLVPFAFGKDWDRTVLVFPWLALAYLANSVFALHSSALYALGRNGDVARFHAAHVVVLAGTAALLVPHWGLTGYGLAEAAALPVYALLHASAVRALGPMKVGLGVVWTAGFGLPLFSQSLGPLAWAGPAAVLALPATRQAVGAWWTQVRELAHG
jgi:PST family polysaccharide transporter